MHPDRRTARSATGATPRPAPRSPTTPARHSSTSSPSLAFLAVAVVALAFDKNIGFAAITAAVVLSMLTPKAYKDTVKQIAWPTVLLVAGVSTYATILTTAGSPEFVGKWAAGLGAAAIGALILCYVGGVVSAFASSTALLPVIIPIAIPLMSEGGLSARLLRRGARRQLDHRRRQPVLHQRCADAGQQAGHDRRDHLLQADPHLRHDRDPRRVRCWSGPPSSSPDGEHRHDRLHDRLHDPSPRPGPPPDPSPTSSSST